MADGTYIGQFTLTPSGDAPITLRGTRDAVIDAKASRRPHRAETRVTSSKAGAAERDSDVPNARAEPTSTKEGSAAMPASRGVSWFIRAGHRRGCHGSTSVMPSKWNTATCTAEGGSRSPQAVSAAVTAFGDALGRKAETPHRAAARPNVRDGRMRQRRERAPEGPSGLGIRTLHVGGLRGCSIMYIMSNTEHCGQAVLRYHRRPAGVRLRSGRDAVRAQGRMTTVSARRRG